MATAVHSDSALQREQINHEPIRLKTWKEVREYFALHLKPIRFNNGRPVYSNDDIKKLDVILPDEE